MEVEFLSRLQFALTIMFHYIFPPLSIGLGVLMVIIEGLYLKTGDRLYEVMARFWTRVFAVNFAMGVASGVVMQFQFGTNWATYSRYVGDVFGSALAAEGIFAFFLESGFLAVLVFGWDRVSAKMHFFATCMVALGAVFSSVWIVVANSWQHTPAGYRIDTDGLYARAVIDDYWAMIFNPSSIDRLAHVLLGAFILGAFVMMSISAFYILKNRHLAFAKRSFTIALLFGTFCSLAMGASGHHQAQLLSKTQPAKLAAFEGHFKTGEGGTPLYLIGYPDEKTEEIKYGIAIPTMLSFLVHEDFHKPVMGLDKFKKEDRPPVLIPFMAYHIMAGLGGYFVGLTVLGCFLLWRKKLFEQRLVLWVFVFSVVGPYIANQTGWIAAEVGRQPFIVYPTYLSREAVEKAEKDGQPMGKPANFEGAELRTTNALSKAVKANQVLSSIIMFLVIYALLFAVWVYVLNDKIQHGPEDLSDTTGKGTGPGLIGAAGLLAKSADNSMTLAKEDEKGK